MGGFGDDAVAGEADRCQRLLARYAQAVDKGVVLTPWARSPKPLLPACQDELHGRTEPRTGIDPFMALVVQVMSQEPYAGAKRVFWIVDPAARARRAPAGRDHDIAGGDGRRLPRGAAEDLARFVARPETLR
ncbi:hypothetical protein [Streptomyces sp. NPDC058092]|uniref:hypothetical protein n=1 Tax=Streptomyces sp. NPDC058092 TaxID=3346336 RepID=UPI0036E2DCA0